MATDPKYAPLMKALGREVDNGAAMIDIWDFDHGSAEPRAILADDALLAIASRHGMPLYVIELAGADPILKEYVTDSDQQLQADRQGLLDQKGLTSEYVPLFDDMRAGKLIVQSPDPRAEATTRFIAGLDAPDKTLFMRYVNAVQGDHPGKTSAESLNAFLNQMTGAERDHFVKLMGGFQTVATGGEGNSKILLDTTPVDKVIAGRVTHVRAEERLKGHTTVMIYGGGHFAKSTPDLDELSLLPGERSVSVAVVSSPAGEFLKAIYQSGGHADLPEYAWYSDQNRLVKLDNDAAKAEFLSIKPQEVATFLKTGVWPSSHNVLMSGANNADMPLRSLGVSNEPVSGSPLSAFPTSKAPVPSDAPLPSLPARAPVPDSGSVRQ